MKTAIVTGAAGNMGRAVLKKFIDEGYFVAGTVLPNDSVQADLPADRFEKTIVDLGDAEDAQKFVENVISKHTTIDAAVLTGRWFCYGIHCRNKNKRYRKAI